MCDFGLAHLKLGSGVMTSRMGSPSWTAPEVLKAAALSLTLPFALTLSLAPSLALALALALAPHPQPTLYILPQPLNPGAQGRGPRRDR